MTTPLPDLEAFAHGLGPVEFLRDAATIARWERTTLPEAHHIAGVARPRNTEEVQQVVRAAGAAGVTIYHVSRGKNWGYGDATPSHPGSVIVDLSGMD